VIKDSPQRTQQVTKSKSRDIDLLRFEQEETEGTEKLKVGEHFGK
jgi:hypothetical protein